MHLAAERHTRRAKRSVGIGLCVLMVVVLATWLSTAGAVKAKDVEFGSFREFTVYSKDGPELKDDILLIFHGFGSAMPNGAYKRLHKALSDDYSVIGFNYDYFDITGNSAAMDRVWDTLLEGRNVVFAGTSLGGFWANHFAEKYGVEKAILVNPVVHPTDQLLQFVGDHFVEKRNADLTVTIDDIARYSSVTKDPHPDLSRLVILSRDDSILDFALAEVVFSGPKNKIVIFDDGGHTVNLKEERYLDVIHTFLDQEDISSH